MDFSIYLLNLILQSAIGKVSNNDEFLQEWGEEYLPEYERAIIIIK